MAIQHSAERWSLSPASFAATRTQNLALLALAMGPIFEVAGQLKPLYTDNQNTKYLHALAHSGFGYLREDWLAHTKDGLPLFTSLLEIIYRTVGSAGFYIGSFAFYALFVFCALVIYRRLTDGHDISRSGLVVFVATLFVLTAITDVQELVFRGFAEQYVLAGYFQTADFGVFLFCAVLLFERRAIGPALLCVVIAAAVHPAYVAPGATLTAIFGLYEIFYGRGEGAKASFLKLGPCVLGLAALLGISLAIKFAFAATDPQAQHEAYHILTAVRIPRHADPTLWLDQNEIIQFALCFTAALLLPAGRFRFVIRLGSAALVVFTLCAFLPNSDAYRLIAPWRLSVVIVPLASIALCTMAIIRLSKTDAFGSARSRLVFNGSLAAILLCTAVGAAFTIAKFRKTEPSYAAFVRTNLAPGQLYLTPPERDEFRLLTGAPQYVNFKSHPYQDVEVLQWYRRLKASAALYQSYGMDCTQLERLAAEDGVTHVLIAGKTPSPTCDFATKIFESGSTKIFLLTVQRSSL